MKIFSENQFSGKTYFYTIASRLSLCSSTVPLLLGLCRALGRFNGCEDPLIAHIFPPKKRRRVVRNPKTSDVQNKVGI